MSNKKHFNVIPLFPSPLLSLVDDSLCDSVENLFDSHTGEWQIPDVVNQNSRTKDVYVLNSNGKLLLNLTSISKELINLVLKTSVDIKITTSWFTKVPPGERGTPHTHNNSWWSGVYYFKDPISPIKFEKFSFGIDPLNENQIREVNEFNSLSFSATPTRGTLLLFPSNTIHCIQKNTENSDRHTLAFNIIPKGKIGNGDAIITL